jgi:hypothetical protein
MCKFPSMVGISLLDSTDLFADMRNFSQQGCSTGPAGRSTQCFIELDVYSSALDQYRAIGYYEPASRIMTC